MEHTTDAFISQLLKKQKDFFESGKTSSISFRLEQLNKLQRAVLSYSDKLAKALEKDLGKCYAESYMTEIGFVLNGISHACKHLKEWMQPTKVRSPLTVFPAKSYVLRQPYGVALIIGPYNYPFQLLIEPLTAAIAAGNCAVLSVSELTPHTSGVIKNMLEQTFDGEYIYCVEGGTENNTVLLKNRFDTIFFTGSPYVGKIVMRAAAENLTPVTLELGGKSPVIVDGSAKLRTACERIAWGKFMNAGQTCVAPDYVFVQKDIAGAFLEELKGAIVRFYGEDIKLNSDYGRIVNERHMTRLGKILDADKDAIVFGGLTDMSERFISPTLLCPPDIEGAACMREEIFGPLLPVFTYSEIEGPLHYINQNEKPLALYIFSENKALTEKIIASTASGGVCVNDTVSHIINTELPFGGVGHSGMGRYHGKYGFQAFSYERAVLRRSTRIKMSLAFPPFTDKKLKTIKKFLK